jgi:LacI family transcriptional regulator
MGKSSRVSIGAIAAEAGVSRNTVSLALRGSDRVKPETARRVAAVAERLGYRPNLLARALATGRSRLWGVLIPRLDYSYMPRILQAVQDVARRENFGLLFLSHENDRSRLPEQLEYFLARRVEGLIVFPVVPPAPAEAWRLLAESGVRSVFLEPTVGAPGAVVSVPEEEAGRMAVEHMAELGHRRLALVGPAGDYFGDLHATGALAAAGRAGLPVPRRWTAPESIAGGRQAAALWLAANERPTGVICFSDVPATGFVQELTSKAIRIPWEVSVTGVDDSPLAEAAAVPLTTLRAPAEEMGRRAAERLLSGEVGTNSHHKLRWRWIERSSTGPAPLPIAKENAQ